MNGASRRLAVACVASSAAYLAAAVVMTALARHGINPDGVAYLRVAKYYAEGRLDYAVNSYWGPLISWLLVPAHWVAGDPVLTVKILGIAFGLLTAIATMRLSMRLGDTARGAWAVFTATLLFCVPCATYVTPDLLLALLIGWYLLLASRLALGGGDMDGFKAGLIGGIAYLAKSYAFPYVLAHAALTALLRYILIRRGAIQGNPLRPFVMLAAGFLVFAAPWIAVISARDGGPTIGSAGKISHAWTLEAECAQHGLPLYDLCRPREGRVTAWESPLEIEGEWPSWSPFDGLAGLKKQAKFSVLNGYRILRYFHRSSFGIAYVAAFLALLAVFPLRRTLASRGAVLRMWLLGSVLLYCAGYDLVLFKPRYFWPIIGPTFAIGSQLFASLRYSQPADLPPAATRPAAPARTMGGVFACMLVVTMLMQTALDMKWAAEPDGHRAQENFIEDMRKRLDIEEPVAANKWDMGLYVCYWEDLMYLNSYKSATAPEVARELGPYAPCDAMVFGDEALARSMRDHPDFTLKQEIEGPTPDARVWLFAFRRQASRSPSP